MKSYQNLLLNRWKQRLVSPSRKILNFVKDFIHLRGYRAAVDNMKRTAHRLGRMGRRETLYYEKRLFHETLYIC